MTEQNSGRDLFLKRNITRREAIRAGGIAAVGLAFSKPLIETVYPKPAFANYKVIKKKCYCYLKVIVLSVKYSGDYLGKDWSFKFRTEAGGDDKWVWLSKYISLGETKEINKYLYYDKVGQHGDDFPFELKIWAEEDDPYKDGNPDDKGKHYISKILNCPDEGHDTITVVVRDEYKKDKFSGKEAVLEFKYAYKAWCKYDGHHGYGGHKSYH